MQNRWSFRLFGGRGDKLSSPAVMSKEESKRRISQALHLTADRPDGVADISACSLTTIPRDFFHLCITYVKTDINCSENLIRDLESGGEIGNLRRIHSLNCGKNLLEKLPVRFSHHFPSLVVLDLSDNNLTCLPDSFSQLKQLKVLLLARNKFTTFPSVSINQSTSPINQSNQPTSAINQSMPLEQLDVSGNEITELPAELGRVVTLKILVLDVEKMVYPIREICTKGTGAILETLRRDMVMPETSEEDSGCLSGCEVDSPSETVARYVKEDERMRDAIRRYNNDEGLQRSQLMRFHAAMDEDHLRHAASVYKGKKSEQESLVRMMEEQQKSESYLHTLTASVEKGKKGLAEALHEMEIHSQRLLAQLSDVTEERTAHFRAYEKDLRKDDLAWRNLHTEIEASKRQEILSAMKRQLEDTEKSDAFYQHLMRIARVQVDNVVNMHRDEERRYVPLLNKAKMEQDNMINRLLQDERVQQEMFQELQLKTDTVHCRILNDLRLLETELSFLSKFDQKKEDEKIVMAKNCLEDERIELVKLYERLLRERETREAELRGVLQEMAKEAIKHEENFWLVQYERLMDSVPPTLLLQNTKMASKTEQRIVEKTLQTRQTRQSDTQTRQSDGQTVEGKTVSGCLPSVLHMETTCIVCLDCRSTSIFLPCGHICCCVQCAEKVMECPLCRTTIGRKLTLSQSVE